MGLDITNFIGGPGVARYKGRTFYAKLGNGITLDMTPELFSTGSDAFNDDNSRVKERLIKVSLTPTGNWGDAAALLPYGSFRTNEMIHRILRGVTFDHTGGNVTSVNNGWANFTAVRFTGSGTLPSGLSRTATYFILEDDADNFLLYPTRADAEANTNQVSFSNNGSGQLNMVENEPLVVHTEAGQKLTLHNARVTKMPELTLSPVDTIFGTVEFTGFTASGVDWADDDSLYTLEDATFSDTGYDDDLTITVPYDVSWGNTAPWSGLVPKDAIKVAWNEQFTPVTTNKHGIVSMRLKSMKPTVSFTPQNVSEADLVALRPLQGSGVRRGGKLTATQTMTIQGPGSNPFLGLYAVQLVKHPFQVKSGEERAGEWVWDSSREIGGGTASDWFVITD